MPIGRILVVDDEVDLATTWCDYLRLKNFVCEKATSADEALKIFQKEFFDVVVLDYLIPGKTGVQLAKEFKRLKPFTRIVVVTGRIDNTKYPEKDVKEDLESLALCDRFMTKPVPEESLLKVLVELLDHVQKKQGDWKARAAEATRERSIDIAKVQELNKKFEDNLRKPPQGGA